MGIDIKVPWTICSDQWSRR